MIEETCLLLIWSLSTLYGLVSSAAARDIKDHIASARTVVELLDKAGPISRELASEIHRLNGLDSLCGKHELDWHVSGKRYHLFRCFTALFRAYSFRPDNVPPPLPENTSVALR